VKNQGQEKTRFAVFYDPCARSEISQAPAPKDTEARRKWADRVEAMSQAESKRLLRLQVQDFVKWLQGQGVI